MIWYLQGCLPCKVKAVYVMHQPWYLSGVWALLKPFLNEKMRMRMHVLGNSRRLLRVAFPGSSLPMQIGGEVRWEPTDWLRARVDQEGAAIMGSTTRATEATTEAAIGRAGEHT